MADNLPNFTIFRLSGSPSLNEIIGNFRSFTELAAPVTPAQAAPLTLYTIPAYSDKGLSVMPVFTDPWLIGAPCALKPPLPFLQTLFNAPVADIFAFNPPHARAAAPGTEIRLDKKQLSMVIGFLQTSKPLPAGAQLEAALKAEAGLGNLHRANYMLHALLAEDPSRPLGLYAETLIDLGLLQDAYDYAKTFQTPEFFYYRARILRHNGEPAKARQWLDKIPRGTTYEDKKRLELAWLSLEEGKTDEALTAFRPLAQNSFEKTAALFGAGAALMKKAEAGHDPAEVNDSLTTFLAALTNPSPLIPKIFFHMGNLHSRTGNFAEAEACHRKAAALWPSIQSKMSFGVALTKTGKFQEAAALINDIALTDQTSAGRLAAELPQNTAAELLEASRQHQDALAPREKQTGDEKDQSPPETAPVASLEPAPKISMRTTQRNEIAPPQPAPAANPERRFQVVEMESLMDAVSSIPLPTEEATRKDDFMGRAFKLASTLEEEFDKKIHFNMDGLTEVERKLRLTFIKERQNPQEAIEIVKDCAAFLCFFLQERYKGRLIKLTEFDHWGWPVIFDTPRHMVTYPIQRAWKLLWKGSIPEPGWLTKYAQYVEDELMSGKTEMPQGAAAVQGRIPSHPERLIDAQTEHRRIIVLTSSLKETADIELGWPGLVKLETAIKANFKPDIPPTADGWKLLRCYGHVLAETLTKEFKASWYNTDGNDGLWSMQLPWKTFIFPIGKVYKAVSNRESLSDYFDILLAEKLRISGGAK